MTRHKTERVRWWTFEWYEFGERWLPFSWHWTREAAIRRTKQGKRWVAVFGDFVVPSTEPKRLRDIAPEYWDEENQGFWYADRGGKEVCY